MTKKEIAMTKNARALLAAALLGSTLATTGCAGTATTKSTGDVIDDAAIATTVKAKMIDDPVVKATNIQVETFKGTVQLSGFASNQAEIDRAVTLAANTKGVKAVKNDIRLSNGHDIPEENAMTTNATTASPIARDFQNVVDDAHQLLKTVEREGEATVSQARTGLNDTLANARAKFDELGAQARESAKKAGMQTRAYVQSNPWQAMGVGAAVGVLVGFLIARR